MSERLPQNDVVLAGEIVAAIAAAVALALKKPHRIVSVKESTLNVEAPVFILNPWSMEGRFQHFGSHKVR